LSSQIRKLNEKMTELISNTTIVIRTIGERTTDLCYQLVKMQVIEKNIFVINENPFHQAVRRTFELGLKNDKPWTIAVDADVLLRRNAIKDLVAKAENCSHQFFKGNAKAYDKFLGKTRYLPPHIYSTKYLQQAVENLPNYFGLRPETEVRNIMKDKLGIQQAYFPMVVAVHDFEQYYADIYRKSFVFGFKHLKRIKQYISFWAAHLHKDKDFLVALAGLFRGLYSDKKIQIDAHKLPTDYQEVKFLSDLDEKVKYSLSSDYFSVENVIRNYQLNKFITNIKHKALTKLKTSF